MDELLNDIDMCFLDELSDEAEIEELTSYNAGENLND